MRKSSANFIWCITYTTEEKICSKMAGMNIVASGCHPCRHHQTGFASGVANCFSTGGENQGRRFNTLRKIVFASQDREMAQVFAKFANGVRHFLPESHVMMKTILGHRLPTGAKTSIAGNISGKIAGINVVVHARCLCRHRRTWGYLRRRESCAQSAQAGPENPIGSLVGSIEIFHFVPLGHLWPTNLGYDAAK